MTPAQTRTTARDFYNGIVKLENVGHLACLLNLKGDKDLMAELFTVKGFRELLAAALPPEQRKMGYLA